MLKLYLDIHNAWRSNFFRFCSRYNKLVPETVNMLSSNQLRQQKYGHEGRNNFEANKDSTKE